MTSPLPAALLLVLAACGAPEEPNDPQESPAPDPATDPDPTTDAPTSEPVLDPPPAIRIDELMPGNDSVIRDDLGDTSDWVELYNASGGDVDLGGWLLQVDGAAWSVPAGTTLIAGERRLLWLTETAGPDHVPLALSDDGGTITLLDPHRQVADALTWPALVDDTAYGRFPSGSAATASTIFATPGVENPVDPGVLTDPSDGLFLTDRILRIDIEVLQPAIAALFDEPYEYVPASLVYDGFRFDSVGLHLKGQIGSLRYPDEKAGWKIDLDWDIPGQRLRGLEKLTLNNMVQDPSCIHETLAYELLRESGSPAPRTGWAEVYLNGDYRGLYLHLESTDDQFLERWFADPEGNLYEGEYGQDLTASWIDDLEIDEVGANDVADRSDLEALAQMLSRPPTEAEVPALEALVDVERTLAAFAVEVVIGHWDGYVNYPNNWRVYHDPSTDQFTLLVSGVDQTFDSYLSLYTGGGDLFVWMVAIPSIRDRYSIALWDAADRLAALDVGPKAAAYQALILPSYQTDPYREGTVAQMQSEIVDTVEFAADRPAEVIGELVP